MTWVKSSGIVSLVSFAICLLFNAIPKSLKPGGVLVFECYTPKQLELKTGGPSAAAPMFSKDMLFDAFAETLELERNEELIRELAEGVYHNGKGAVVQFIARKSS